MNQLNDLLQYYYILVNNYVIKFMLLFVMK